MAEVLLELFLVDDDGRRQNSRLIGLLEQAVDRCQLSLRLSLFRGLLSVPRLLSLVILLHL